MGTESTAAIGLFRRGLLAARRLQVSQVAQKSSQNWRDAFRFYRHPRYAPRRRDLLERGVAVVDMLEAIASAERSVVAKLYRKGEALSTPPREGTA